MRLRRMETPAAIPLVPMIDVMMILLVFFMVTSTYLDLDMLPLGGGDAPGREAETAGAIRKGPLLVRVGADGAAHLGGVRVAEGALAGALGLALADAPGREVLILPSGAADVQALVRVMDAGVAARASRIRVVRLEEAGG